MSRALYRPIKGRGQFLFMLVPLTFCYHPLMALFIRSDVAPNRTKEEKRDKKRIIVESAKVHSFLSFLYPLLRGMARTRTLSIPVVSNAIGVVRAILLSNSTSF